MKLDMCTEQNLDPDPTIPTPCPDLVWGYLVCPDECVNYKGNPVCGCTVIVFTVGGVGVDREGEGKWRISY